LPFISFWTDFKYRPDKTNDILLCFQNPYFSEKQNDVIHFLIILTTFYFHKTKRTQKKALNITFYNTDLTIYFETFKREITKSL